MEDMSAKILSISFFLSLFFFFCMLQELSHPTCFRQQEWVRVMTYFSSYLKKMWQPVSPDSPGEAFCLPLLLQVLQFQDSLAAAKRLCMVSRKSVTLGYIFLLNLCSLINWSNGIGRITRQVSEGFWVISGILKSSALYLCKMTIRTESAIGLEIGSIVIIGPHVTVTHWLPHQSSRSCKINQRGRSHLNS